VHKKKDRKEGKSQDVYISRICGATPSGRISTKLVKSVRLIDVIKFTKFLRYNFRGFGAVRCWSFHVAIETHQAVLNTLLGATAPQVIKQPISNRPRSDLVYDVKASQQSKLALLKLFNWAIPRKWKEAIIISFLKFDKDPGSYRPIAITSCIGKVMERIIMNRSNWFYRRQANNQS